MVKISVVMGTYNSEKVVGEAIKSIQNQTLSEFELIICDDCSSDNTYRIIEKIAQKDSRIKLIKNNQNLGLAKTLNRCIEISNGDFVARMDDDDISHPDRLKIQYDFLKENIQYALVGSSVNLFDENGIWGSLIYEGERNSREVFSGKNFVHPSVLIRKKDLNSVGNYTESILTRRGQDFDLWCKFYFAGLKGFNLKEILLDYHESKNSITRRKFKFRLTIFINKIIWRKKLNLPFFYLLYAIKEIIIGIIPRQILLKYKMTKLKKRTV